MKRNAENPNLAERVERLERRADMLLLTVVVQTAILFIQYREISFVLDSFGHLYTYMNQLMNCVDNLQITFHDLLVALHDQQIALHDLLVGLKD